MTKSGNTRLTTIHSSNLRGVIVFVSVVFLAASCGTGSTEVSKSAQKLHNVVVGGVTGAYFEEIPITIAQKEGFFAKEGLSVRTEYSSSGPGATLAMASGSTDFAFNGTNVALAAIAKGVNEPIIQGMFSGNNWYVMAGRGVSLSRMGTGSPTVSALSVLKGRPIGITAPGSAVEAVFIELLKAGGLQPAAGQLVPVGGNAALEAALQSGEIDFTFCEPPTCQQEVAKSIGKVWLPFSAIPTLRNFPTNVWQVNGTYGKAHTQQVNAFKKSIAMAVQWARNKGNFNAVVAMLQSGDPGLSNNAAQTAANKEIPLMSSSFTSLEFQTAQQLADVAGVTQVSKLNYNQVMWHG